jgi:hypothetical protein
VIASLVITLLVESAFVTAFTLWRKKPLVPLLVSSVCANVLTQAILWVVLISFPQYYLTTLLVTEVGIWVLEALILYIYRPNHLRLRAALLLSLVMNLASFGIGWLLPV